MVNRVLEYNEEQLHKMLIMSEYHIKNHPLLNLIKAIEELSELQKQLCRYLIIELLKKLFDESGEIVFFDLDELFNEIFDAEFMIFQAKDYFLVSKENKIRFKEIVDNKLDREMKRWRLE